MTPCHLSLQVKEAQQQLIGTEVALEESRANLAAVVAERQVLQQEVGQECGAGILQQGVLGRHLAG